MAPRIINASISRDEVVKDIHKILRLVKPEWRETDIKLKDLSSNGYINTNIACYTGEQLDEDAVVIRVYESEMLQHFRRDIEMGTYLIDQAGLAPKVLCYFKNGTCMKFFTGTVFTWKTSKQLYRDDIEKAICREMAKYHSTSLLRKAEKCRISTVFAGLDPDWVGYRWKIVLANPEIPKSFKDMIPTQESLYSMIENLESLLTTLNSPRRFCHMDINPTNIIYNDKQKRACILDYENPTIYFVACELAWYFMTLTDLTQLNEADYPDESYRRKFLSRYLRDRRHEENLSQVVTEEEIHVFSKHIDIGFLLTALRMVIVGYVLGSYTPPHAPIAMMERLVTVSLKMYEDRKEQTLDLKPDLERWTYKFPSF